MKGIFIAVIILLGLSCTQTNQTEKKVVDKKRNDSLILGTKTSVPEEQKKIPDPIVTIRKKVEHINTTTLTKKHVEFMCDEQTMVDFYTENGKIVKISIDFGTVGDVYAKEDYYYDEAKLIFFYEFVEGGPACEGCIKTNEYRSYIKDDKVIKYLKDKDQQQCRKCEFGPSSRQYKLLTARTPAEIKQIICKM